MDLRKLTTHIQTGQSLQSGNVTHIAVLEMHALSELLRQRLTGFRIVVENGNLAALGMEGAHDALADAARAAGDENGFVLKETINCLDHRTLVCLR